MFIQFYSDSLRPLLQGFILCAGLIIVIGPQNLFLLRQGLHRRHLLVTALLCTFFDLVLIALGVGGLGVAIAANQQLLTATTLGGSAFLLGYGVRAFHSAWCTPAAAKWEHDTARQLSMKGTLLATLTFSFLNPAAYIDTLLLIGTASGRYPIDERFIFGAGAVMASALWFFLLIYGSSRLTPIFTHPFAWRTLDIVSGCIMVGIAVAMGASQTSLLYLMI